MAATSVPVAGKMNACPVVVLKTFRRSRNRPVASSGNAEERWSSIARFMARRIRSGTFVGPGTNRKLRPGIKSVLNERGKTQRVAKVFRDLRPATPRMGRGEPA